MNWAWGAAMDGTGDEGGSAVLTLGGIDSSVLKLPKLLAERATRAEEVEDPVLGRSLHQVVLLPQLCPVAGRQNGACAESRRHHQDFSNLTKSDAREECRHSSCKREGDKATPMNQQARGNQKARCSKAPLYSHAGRRATAGTPSAEAPPAGTAPAEGMETAAGRVRPAARA
ncbi:hypothetical protein Taro_042423, partial [Colocasia esculenta]|nr:hypothetical protein [Colocasia esculenta]